MVKAAVLYEANQPMIIKDLKQENPKSNEVKVKMLAAGVCASDHHVMKGETAFPMPIVVGHEGAGIIEDVGENVTSVSKGDKCILSFVASCGSCVSCRNGLGNLCDTNRITGTKQYDGTFRLRDEKNEDIHQMAKLGVFAEEIIIPENACFKIDDDVPIDVACLIGCSVTTGVGGVINQKNIFPGASIAVFGTGGVGLNTILGGQIINSSKIIDFLKSVDFSKLNLSQNSKKWTIPVCYDFEMDLENMSKTLKMNKDEIINIHLNTDFFVYMIGFVPGHPFMGDLKSKLFLNRLKTPRVKIPAGSVGIVEKFCNIYPYESPGGWNIIGRTPTKLFNTQNESSPCLLSPGDSVKFKSISKKEFEKLANE